MLEVLRQHKLTVKATVRSEWACCFPLARLGDFRRGRQ